MGEIRLKEKVKLICGITFNSRIDIEEILEIVENEYGPVSVKSEIFPFTFTDYYSEEMGEDLKKVFVAFDRLIDADTLPDIKIYTNKIEEKYTHDNKRDLNLDPGYITHAKLVLATTKNYSHRLYLRDGIFGDVHLTFHDGHFTANPWTYPDYKADISIGFFEKVREEYCEDRKVEDSVTYASSGVDIDEAEKAVKNIKSMAKSTFGVDVLTDLGKFGGFFKLDLKKYYDPVLVSSIDGVGTKLKVAIMNGTHHTVGQDLVNHCVDDILACGAKPLFFLDYIGTTNLKSRIIEGIISGMAKACRENNCALIGGEMAEMPGFYKPGDYDLAGCIVGVVEKNKVVDGTGISKGDVLFGLPSTGLHTNGYSLARKIFFDIKNYSVHKKLEGLESDLGTELLKVHKSYFKIVHPLVEDELLTGIAHITGGGLIGNISRLLGAGLSLDIDWNSWDWLPIFNVIMKEGNVPLEEMRRVFNLGIGMVLIVSEENSKKVSMYFENSKVDYKLIGKVI